MSRMMDFEGRTGAVAYIHQQAAATLSHLDAKATIFSTIATGALVYLSSLQGFASLAKILGSPLLVRETIAALSARDLVNLTLVVAAIIGFSLIFYFSMRCLWPRSGNKGEGVIYFRNIAKRADDSVYVQELSGLSEAQLSEELSRDTFFLAQIADRKFRASARAAKLFWPATIFLVVAKMVEVAFELAKGGGA